MLKVQFEEISNEHPIKGEREFINDALVQIYLHRQADPVTMVSILSPKHGLPQDVADGLVALAEMSYMDYDMTSKKFSLIYDISDDVKDQLERYQYPMPMVTPPREITNNYETGYETIEGCVILNSGSVYYGKDIDVCIDHLNRVNAVPLVFDFDTINSVQGRYQKPVRKHEEGFDDFNRRTKQARVFFDTSIEVMEGINNVSDEIYLTHKFDRRGRTYASGYHVNTQGTDYHKAAVQFANKELVH